MQSFPRHDRHDLYSVSRAITLTTSYTVLADVPLSRVSAPSSCLRSVTHGYPHLVSLSSSGLHHVTGSGNYISRITVNLGCALLVAANFLIFFANEKRRVAMPVPHRAPRAWIPSNRKTEALEISV